MRCWTLVALLFSSQVFAGELSLEEKIAQLFVIPVGEHFSEEQLKEVKRLIAQEKVGGILPKQGTLQGQCQLIEELQQVASIPLLCLQDAEWGTAMRLKGVPPLPKNLTLGAIADRSLLYAVGEQIGCQCLQAGAHLNLAPVVDVNTNPLNPIIHMRSFGEDPLKVALCAEQVHLGMRSVGMRTCLKHFPGHGNVTQDSHLELPLVESFQEGDLFPFKYLINQGVDAVLTAHLLVPSLTQEENLPVTFSRRVIHDLLREQWGFEGLIISDALNMKALTNTYTPSEIAPLAFRAGHDLLLYGDHIAPNIDQILFEMIPQGMRAIKQAVLTDPALQEELDAHVERILNFKRSLSYHPSCPVESLNQELYRQAVTLVKNERLLPLTGDRIALITIGEETPFLVQALEKGIKVDPIEGQDLSSYPCAIVVISDLNNKEQLQALKTANIPIVLVFLASPYLLTSIPFSYDACLIAYESAKEAQEAAAEALLGSLSPQGELPVTLPCLKREK